MRTRVCECEKERDCINQILLWSHCLSPGFVVGNTFVNWGSCMNTCFHCGGVHACIEHFSTQRFLFNPPPPPPPTCDPSLQHWWSGVWGPIQTCWSDSPSSALTERSAPVSPETIMYRKNKPFCDCLTNVRFRQFKGIAGIVQIDGFNGF